VQCDASIKAIINKIDSAKNDFIVEDLDDETVLIKESKLAELKQRLKEVCLLLMLESLVPGDQSLYRNYVIL
jgi:hypothetical protein